MPRTSAARSVDAPLQTLDRQAIDTIEPLLRNGCASAMVASAVASGCRRTARAPREADVPLARRGGGLGHAGAHSREASRGRPCGMVMYGSDLGGGEPVLGANDLVEGHVR